MSNLKSAVAGSTLMAVFLCSLGNSRFTFKNGKDAVFLQGRYLTNNEAEVKELLGEIQDGHPHITVPSDPDEQVVDTKYVDPMEAIRAQVRAELIAEQLAIRASTADMGTTKQDEKLVVGNTKTAGDAMSGSTSGDGAAGVTAPSTVGTATVAAPQVTMGAKIVAGPRA